MSIRVANKRDLPQIGSLIASLSHFYLDAPGQELPLWFRDTITEEAFASRVFSSEYLSFVFEEAGILIGYISLKGGNHLYYLFVSETRGISRLKSSL